MLDTDTRVGERGPFPAPMSTFIGRTREIEDALAVVEHAKLLTVTEPGGVGKTRFARELLNTVESSDVTESVMVDLSALSTPQQIPAHLVAALGVADQSNRDPLDQVIRRIGTRDVILLVDNCEHVVRPVAALADQLLDACPQLRIVATSTVPFGSGRETLLVLPPLELPSLSHGAGQSESEALLVDRARRVQPGFAITESNRRDVRALCLRLDGLPLAIEIAASKLRALSPRQVLERLDARLRLAPDARVMSETRHATVQSMVEWSYERCTTLEQIMWVRLSIFSGWFDLDAAEEACAFGSIAREEVVEHIDALIGKSVLMVAVEDGSARYRQLYGIRGFGRELLSRAAEDAEVLNGRYVSHFAAKARRLAREWYGPDQAAHLRAIRADYAELDAILEQLTGTQEGLAAAAAITTDLRYFWVAGGMLSAGRRWLDRVVERGDPPKDAIREALWVRAWIALLQGDERVAARDVDLLRSIPDLSAAMRARVDFCSGLRNLFIGRLDESIREYRRAIDTFIMEGDRAMAGTALFQMAVAECYLEDYGGATATCDRVLALASGSEERWNLSYALWVSALCSWHERDVATARQRAGDSLEHQREFLDGICIALTLHVLPWIALEEDDADSARVLIEHATRVWHAIGTNVAAFGPHLRGEADTALVRMGFTMTGTGDSTAGPRVKLDAVEAGVEFTRRPSRPAVSGHDSLTQRESEVADAISRGLSNKAIAAELHVSPRTVEGHVERILARLDCESRTQVATRVLRSRVPAPG